MIESGIVSLLRANSAITTLTGGRLYAVLVPPTAVYPCLSYTTMSKPPVIGIDYTGIEAKRIQFDCWGKTYSSVKSLQVALHTLLDGYFGTMPDGSIVIKVLRDVEADYWESDSETFRAMSEYLITYPSGYAGNNAISMNGVYIASNLGGVITVNGEPL